MFVRINFREEDELSKVITVINYSDERFEKARKYNSKSAIDYGQADNVIEYSPNNLPDEYIARFSYLDTRNNRITGRYGLWRPYIVLDAFKKIKEDDYLCYSDAGLYFINSIRLLVRRMEEESKDIMVFGLPFVEKQWTKGDVFEYFEANNTEIKDSPQIMSTIFLAKKNNNTIHFFENFKLAAENAPSLFTDEKNQGSIPNDPIFIENRHNQSVFSVLCKKNKIEVFRDPSEYGVKPMLYKYLLPKAQFIKVSYKNSDYPQIIVHHRSKEIRKDVLLFAWIRQKCSPLIAVRLFQIGHYLKYMFKKDKWG